MKIKTFFIFVTIVLLLSGCATTATTPSNVQPKFAASSKNDDMTVLSKLKNKNELISAVLKIATASYLESNGFGTMRDFSIDTTHKAFSFSVDLKGESSPLKVAVPKYELLRERGMLFFVVKDVSTDKQWINQAAKMFLKEKRIEIPGKYAALVQLVM